MSDGRRTARRRVPGWLVVLLMALFIAGMGAAIWYTVRQDPSLPRAPIERR
jgi:hypothetical protein